MKKISLKDIDLLAIGNTVQISGVIYSGDRDDYLCFLPEYQDEDGRKPLLLEMDDEDWEKFLRQSDLMETEILTKAKDGKLAKAIVRKSARQIDQRVSWQVYKRDNYTCRYCGQTGIPLTVDHLVLWENGGPSTLDNLLTACKKCNKKRGNMEYAEWLECEKYQYASAGLTPEVKEANKEILKRLHKIPVRVHMKSR